MGAQEDFQKNLKLETAESIAGDLSAAKDPVTLYKKAIEVLAKMEKNFDVALGSNPYDYFDGLVEGGLVKTKFEKKAVEYRSKANQLSRDMGITGALYVLAESKLGISSINQQELNTLIQGLLSVQEQQRLEVDYDLNDGKLDNPDHVTSVEWTSFGFDINNPIIKEVEKKTQEALASDKLTLSKEDFNAAFYGELGQAYVGNCYFVSMLKSMSSSPLFELMVRSSVKKLPNGEWVVRLPLMDETAQPNRSEELLGPKKVRINQSEISGEWKKHFGIEGPLTGSEGFRVLEAAYFKFKFGSVDEGRAKWGGNPTEALRYLGGNNFGETHFESYDRENTKKEALYYFLMRYHKSGYIAGATSLSHDRGLASEAGLGVYKAQGSVDFFRNNHAYSIVDIHPDQQIIVMANPWDTGKTFSLTFQQFEQNFAGVSAVKINHAEVLKNIEHITNK